MEAKQFFELKDTTRKTIRRFWRRYSQSMAVVAGSPYRYSQPFGKLEDHYEVRKAETETGGIYFQWNVKKILDSQRNYEEWASVSEMSEPEEFEDYDNVPETTNIYFLTGTDNERPKPESVRDTSAMKRLKSYIRLQRAINEAHKLAKEHKMMKWF